MIEALKDLYCISEKLNVNVFLVGGVIRDLLLGKVSQDQDIDITIEGESNSFVSECHKNYGGELKRFPDFFTSKISSITKFKDVTEIDFAETREEIYPNPGSLPKVKRASLGLDLCRRDFTINAMALPLGVYVSNSTEEGFQNHIIDPFRGLADLKESCIRVLHSTSFIDDPTRLFRAIRYATRLNGNISPESAYLFNVAMKNSALKTISVTRAWNEIRRLGIEKEPLKVLSAFAENSLLSGAGFITTNREEDLRERINASDIDKLDSKIWDAFVFALLLKLSPDSEVLKSSQFPKSLRKASLQFTEGKIESSFDQAELFDSLTTN